MPAEALWQKPVTELIKLLEERAVSPVEITQSCIDRFEAINGQINALVAWNHEDSLRQARRSEKRMLDGKRLSPIDGIPCTVKDNIHARGFTATWGSLAYRGFQPDADDCCVENLRDAGVVIFGKTNTPEFALSAHTDNRVFGRTLNPWNLSLTPGGSSGGAAASVAAGITPLAVATDAGGSIRRPCSYTGLAGLRTTTGLIPRRAGFPALVHDFQVIGPMARTTSGLHALLRVISRGSPLAAEEWAPGHATAPELPEPESRLRIRMLTELEGHPVDSEIAETVKNAADFFSDRGHRVETVPAPYDPAFIGEVWHTLSSYNLHRLLSPEKIASGQITPAMVSLWEQGKQISSETYKAAIDAVEDFRRAIQSSFEAFDLLLTPASAAMPWLADQPYPKEIEGQPVGPRGAAIFATVVNASGLPALCLPAGFSHAGLPIGMQLVGKKFADTSLLSMGKQFEDATCLHQHWPNALKNNT